MKLSRNEFLPKTQKTDSHPKYWHKIPDTGIPTTVPIVVPRQQTDITFRRQSLAGAINSTPDGLGYKFQYTVNVN